MDYLASTTAHQKYFQRFIITIFLLVLGLSGCSDSPVSPPQESKQSVEEVHSGQDQEGQGVSALESARNGGLGAPAMGQAANDLAISASQWTDPDSLPAFYCVSNTAQAEAREGYATTAIALHFPPEMVREADGEKMKFRYQIYRIGDAGQIDGYRPEDRDVISRSYCLMPSGSQVLELMRRFIDQSLADRFGETYGFIAPKPEPGARAGRAVPVLPGLIIANPLDDPPTTGGLGGGGGGGGGSGGGGSVYDGGSMGTIVVTAPRWDGPDSNDDVPPPPDFSDEDPLGNDDPYHGTRWAEGGAGSSGTGDPGDHSNRNDENCRGSAAAVTPISSVMTPDGEGPLYDGPSWSPCDDEPGDEEKNNMEIDASDLKNHPKANCVYGKLNNSGTFKGVISKFAGENTSFDLNIEVADLGSGRDDANASLNSRSSTDTFTMQINSQKIDRTPIEIAGTFLHEALHAEMRRYLYGATDTSTLPGFPGDFSTDWKKYVQAKYGEISSGAVTNAEHQTMAEKYINIMADGLEEYDNNKLGRSSYEALAWNGLTQTMAWKNLAESNKNEIGVNYDDALSGRSQKCH